MWHVDLVGKPYAQEDNPPNSFNCGGLVRYVFKNNLGIDSPEIQISCHNMRNHIRKVESYLSSDVFVTVTNKPRKEYDIARMYLASRPCHVGIYTQGGILHALDQVGVCWDRIFDLKSQYRIEFLRHAKLL